MKYIILLATILLFYACNVAPLNTSQDVDINLNFSGKVLQSEPGSINHIQIKQVEADTFYVKMWHDNSFTGHHLGILEKQKSSFTFTSKKTVRISGGKNGHENHLGISFPRRDSCFQKVGKIDLFVERPNTDFDSTLHVTQPYQFWDFAQGDSLWVMVKIQDEKVFEFDKKLVKTARSMLYVLCNSHWEQFDMEFVNDNLLVTLCNNRAESILFVPKR